MWRCGCQHGCPSSWQGRWDVFTHWWTSKAWPFIKRWSWVPVVCALIGLGFWLPTTTRFKSILAWINNLNTGLMILAFVSIQTLLTVLFLPGALFVLLAGFTQGFFLGTLVAWTGSVLGAVGAFLLGRQVIAERVRKWAAESPFFTAVLRAIDSAGEGWKITLLLRLSPLMPYALINYLLSSTQISFVTYTWTTAVGVLPPTALYVYLGTTAASLSDILGDAFASPEAPEAEENVPYSPDAPFAPVAPVEGPSAMDTTSLWVMGIGVVLTIAVAVLVTVFTSRAIKKASRMGELEAAAANMLDGSSAEEDEDEVEMSMLDVVDDDGLGGLGLSKDPSSGRSSLAASATSDTELLGDSRRHHSEGRGGDEENDSDTEQQQLPRRSRLGLDDSDSDSDGGNNGGNPSLGTLGGNGNGNGNGNSSTTTPSVVQLDPPFSYVQQPANSRLSLADSQSSL